MNLSIMFLLCETYAEEHTIRFNSSKSQLTHFTDKKKVKRDISIEMKNGSKIKMVDKLLLSLLRTHLVQINTHMRRTKYLKNKKNTH